ncbi:MAG: T9SS type A sorting domain-containing protein [Flavobacteriaceae bacterium]|nr:T9SS type A sorting domain-containing protein [Flavobacteriaceae bacterium]
MRFLLILIIVCIYNVKAQDSIVYIPDSNFKQSLIRRPLLNTNGDDEIQYSEAIAYTGNIGCLNSHLWPEQMTDATGIEAFVNITRVNFTCGSAIDSLNLNLNTQLNFAFLDSSGISQIYVNGATNLEWFSIANNNLSQIDLHNNINLDFIHLGANLSLWQMNLANGNNENMTRVVVNELPNLTCVQIDPGFVVPQPGDGTHGWWYDDYSVFSEDCWQDDLATEEVSAVKNNVQIYPNPARDMVHIKSDLPIEQLQLFDLQGKLLKTIFATNTLDLSALPKGAYVVKIFTSEGVVTKKVIRE